LHRRGSLLLIGLLTAAPAAADTLFLRVGKRLKIEAIGCARERCLARVAGGEIELRPADVLRVEPDEPIDHVAPQRAGTPESASGPPTIDELVSAAARKYALPASLVRAVAKAESALDPRAVSPKGARGVMQLMPATARELGVENALDPAENIEAGARLLRELLEKYGGRVAEALAAYNAGEGAVLRHRGVPPYRETRAYIRRVVKEFEEGEKSDSASGKEP